MTCCPHCNGTGIMQATPAPAIAALEAALRAACQANGALVTADNRTDEQTAAMLIGLKPKTLSNWRHTQRPIAFVKRSGRVLYAIYDLAAWMAENRSEPEI
jgi:hypothetical protein